ncbi:aspartate--tRNA ligase [Flavobacteriaceae bacterium]|jgi:aspartyl-tRNA synthetase|nr:aspartate--tRNA ligase [Flavobacteriaceae bacterium]MDA8807851.1 aspartate--tRNA ligase [Flavobacteriaceae bacterium]MDA9176708.1 aspartate--tRNA ligase [Flavobacteriaceae bacterium]MDB4601285.1 aspartate--tRNA ligase [Flavobacteriaceae bacterium]MDC0354688.1 aspartate--tRNA ligase [Flavobacteriaceae bacterium]|tara:strand:+ start:636 stop:2390 length:1755 start_codon:yes stop_codon:yes gene_type:complete
MYRTHNCGELRLKNLDQQVTLSGWVQKSRNKGFMLWIDLRDRFGVSQLIFDEHRSSKDLFEKAKTLGREFVIQVKGSVIERTSKNPNIATGEIEILVSELTVLNESLTPPFTIEDKTDGGEELRMKYRYLDIRRNSIKEKLIFRHKVSSEIRNYLTALDFIDVETPYLIKSTPEGARDFVVPSRMNQGEFYALPQSPQTFKQLLMVGGIDKYFQIVKCFRDEDLRADRQPEFTQIDCEMSFVNQEDILNTFEGLVRHLLSSIKNINVDDFPRMTYDQAMSKYGCDKPDIRFGMELGNLNEVSMHKEFNVFNSSELVVGIAVPNGNTFTRKQIDSYTNWVKRPQIGAKGLVYVRCNDDGSFKSSVDKFYDQEDLGKWANITGAVKGDLIFILSGEVSQVRAQISALRLEVAENLDLRKSDEFAPLWVTDFPLLEWDAESQKYHAMHHPFTSPKLDQLDLLEKSPAKVKANAYDLVLNGNEIGGGSIRIHDKKIQGLMFKHLGFSEVQAKEQFGFLMNAFEYGAPPHGGIALGLDRLVAILHGEESIKDYIAFPKNNSGKDVMIDAPSKLDDVQLNELSLKLKSSK